MNKRSIVLTGFMGTGKTTVGKLLAERLDLPFVDMDEVIVERVGMSVAEIFEKHGEPTFRAWESVIAAELGADAEPKVIATGGGTFLNPANLEALRHATLICLVASPEQIFRRIQHETQRPLLKSDDPQARIEQLLYERRLIYNQIRWQVPTDWFNVEEIADNIQNIWKREAAIRASETRVKNPEGSYPLLIDHGLLTKIQDILDIYELANRRTIIITDSNVVKLHGEALLGAIPNSALVVMSAGETFKHMDTVNHLYNQVAQHGLDRQGLIIALGGGVVGDTAGFVAASYMRGVRFVQIPTSLLAMVDSSVGGKVGVDIPMGKNLVGAFKQPDLVIIDPDVLTTLPEEELRAGMAEVIKHGFLANLDLLRDDMPLMERIKTAIQVKIEVVEEDPYEQGRRAYLNLGHTFGHAIERVSGYSWRHGDAVAVGMVAAAYLSNRLLMLNNDDKDFIENTIAKAGLPTRYRHYSPESIWDAMALDKKWAGGKSFFVLLEGLNKPVSAIDIDKTMVLDVLERLRA